MLCNNCGKKMKDDAVFCPSCGVKVNMDAVSEGADKAPSAIISENTDVKNKKKSKGGTIAAIIIAVVVIAAGAGTALYFTGDTYKIGKNVKLAAESYENGDYDSALEYYEAVLELDDTRADVYAGMAQIYLEQCEYDDALNTLRTAENNCETTDEDKASLAEKKLSAYIGIIDGYIASGNYTDAYEVLNQGISESVGTDVLTKKLSDTYMLEADADMNAGNYDAALTALSQAQGISEADNATIIEKKVEAYQKKAEALLAANDYTSVYDVLNDGIADTNSDILKDMRIDVYYAQIDDCINSGDFDGAFGFIDNAEIFVGDSAYGITDALLEKKAAVYRAKSDYYLAQDECVKAIEVLVDGEQATGVAALSEREEYVREHVVPLYIEYGGVESGYYEYEYYESGKLKKQYIHKTFYELTLTECEYNTLGNMTKKVCYYSDGTIGYTAEYDTSGNMTKEVYYKQDGTISYRSEYVYNSLGNILNESIYDEYGKRKHLKGYEYDEHGNLTVRKDDDNDGVIHLYFLYNYKYDDNGNIVFKVKYNEYNRGWTEYEYDASGNVLNESLYNPDESLVYMYSYEYDGNGNVIKMVHHNEYRDYIESEYEYDTSGNITKKVFYNSDGTISNLTEYEYDMYGNRTEKSTYYKSNGIISNQYVTKYDIFNNIYKSTSSSNASTYKCTYKYIGD